MWDLPEAALGGDALQALVSAVQRLDARMDGVVQDVAGLQRSFKASGSPMSGPDELKSVQYSELSDYVEEVNERLQRLELLLFRLPMPDFQHLDQAIDKMMNGGPAAQGGCAEPLCVPMES